jgi:hypothetical protein
MLRSIHDFEIIWVIIGFIHVLVMNYLIIGMLFRDIMKSTDIIFSNKTMEVNFTLGVGLWMFWKVDKGVFSNGCKTSKSFFLSFFSYYRLKPCISVSIFDLISVFCFCRNHFSPFIIKPFRLVGFNCLPCQAGQ